MRRHCRAPDERVPTARSRSPRRPTACRRSTSRASTSSTSVSRCATAPTLQFRRRRRHDRGRLPAARAAIRGGRAPGVARVCAGFGDAPKRLRVKVRVPGTDPAHADLVGGLASDELGRARGLGPVRHHFDGHPDLRRILMPDDWEGHPARKDYPVQIKMTPKVYEPLQLTRAGVRGQHAGRPRPRAAGVAVAGWRWSTRRAWQTRSFAAAIALHERDAQQPRAGAAGRRAIDRGAAGRAEAAGIRQWRQRVRRAAPRRRSWSGASCANGAACRRWR